MHTQGHPLFDFWVFIQTKIRVPLEGARARDGNGWFPQADIESPQWWATRSAHLLHAAIRAEETARGLVSQYGKEFPSIIESTRRLIDALAFIKAQYPRLLRPAFPMEESERAALERALHLLDGAVDDPGWDTLMEPRAFYPAKKRRGGSQPRYNAETDAALLKHWQAARNSGSTVKEFARERNAPLVQIRRALDRARKRRK